MAGEIIEFLVTKFSSLAAEAEQLRTPIPLLSHFKSIANSIKFMLQDKQVDWRSVDPTVAETIQAELHKAVDELSDCILLSRTRSTMIGKDCRNIISTGTRKARLYRIEETFKQVHLPQDLPLTSQNQNNYPAKWRLTPPIKDLSEIIGFDRAAKEIESRLTDYTINGKGRGLATIGIVGMAGSGKTALANKVFDRMQSQFDTSIWFCLGRESSSPRADQTDLRLHLLMHLSGCNADEEDQLLKLVETRLEGKRCLLVLDEVWDVNNGWYADLKGSSSSSSSSSNVGTHNSPRLSDGLSKASAGAIIVTSRLDNVARMMVGKKNMFNVSNIQLSKDDIWSIFKNNYKRYYADDITDEKVKYEIIECCDSLPLVAKEIAANFGTIIGATTSQS